MLGTFKLRDDIPTSPLMGFDSSRLISTFSPNNFLFAGMVCPTKGQTNVANCETVWGHIKTTAGSDS
jgi:hypothetical protein